MKLIFVRHGKDDDRYRGGWSDLDLIPEGIEQAQKLAKHLKENNFNYKISNIISSDLQRTMTTAKYISAELEIPIQQDNQIREINNGDLADILNEVALIKYPGMFFNSLGIDEPYPNGESPREFYKRIEKWFSSILSENDSRAGNTVIVTHSGVINVIYHLVKGLEWSNRGFSFKAENCSVHILNIDTMEFEVENKIDFLLK